MEIAQDIRTGRSLRIHSERYSACTLSARLSSVILLRGISCTLFKKNVT